MDHHVNRQRRPRQKTQFRVTQSPPGIALFRRQHTAIKRQHVLQRSDVCRLIGQMIAQLVQRLLDPPQPAAIAD